MSKIRHEDGLGDSNETIAFIEQMTTGLNRRLQMLNMKDMLGDEKRQNMSVLFEKLEGLRKCINDFELCEKSDNSSGPFDMRRERGRQNFVYPDSGIGSRYMPTPEDSSNRLSRGDTENTVRRPQIADNDFPKLVVQFDPSITDTSQQDYENGRKNNNLADDKTRHPGFYLESSSSSSSLSSDSLTQHECVGPPSTTFMLEVIDRIEYNRTEVQNDLSKKSSEEDNTKQA